MEDSGSDKVWQLYWKTESPLGIESIIPLANSRIVLIQTKIIIFIFYLKNLTNLKKKSKTNTSLV